MERTISTNYKKFANGKEAFGYPDSAFYKELGWDKEYEFLWKTIGPLEQATCATFESVQDDFAALIVLPGQMHDTKGNHIKPSPLILEKTVHFLGAIEFNATELVLKFELDSNTIDIAHRLQIATHGEHMDSEAKNLFQALLNSTATNDSPVIEFSEATINLKGNIISPHDHLTLSGNFAVENLTMGTPIQFFRSEMDNAEININGISHIEFYKSINEKEAIELKASGGVMMNLESFGFRIEAFSFSNMTSITSGSFIFNGASVLGYPCQDVGKLSISVMTLVFAAILTLLLLIFFIFRYKLNVKRRLEQERELNGLRYFIFESNSSLYNQKDEENATLVDEAEFERAFLRDI